MKLEIKKINSEKIIACFANEEIEISKTSENWNTGGINKFLIKLASAIPNNEQIDLVYNKDEEDLIYKHVVSLFFEFSNEFNKLNAEKK